MSDLERQLEEVFMRDSDSREVTNTFVPRRRTSPLRAAAFVGATALAAIAFVVAFNTLRPEQENRSSLASPTASPQVSGSQAPSATATASPTTAASSTPSSTGTQVRPDAQHGLLTQRGPNLRTEATAADLIQPPQFAQYAAAVSPDGRRVVVLRSSQTGQQLITFTTSRPNDVTTVLDLSGSGEHATSVVWAGDGSASVLLGVSRSREGGVDPPAEYSVLRSVDLGTRATRDELRLTDGAYFVPVAWHPRTRAAVAVTTGAGGFATDYVLVRAGEAARTAFPRGAVVSSSVRATQDGMRVLAPVGATNTERVLRWWPFDRFDAQQELRPASGEAVAAASWRPGSDEFGVSILPVIVQPNNVARLELWSTGGARRVVSSSVGHVVFRHDGTAGITGELQLIDLATGALTPLPRATPEEMPYLAVLF